MKTLHTCAWFWIAAFSLIATPAWADGELDTSFGTNGVVKINFPNSSQGYLRDAATVNGAIIAAGFAAYNGQLEQCSYPDLFIVKLSLTGAIIGSPSTYPQHTVECPEKALVDPATGDIFLVGFISGSFDPLRPASTVVARFDSNGTLLATRQWLCGNEAAMTIDAHSRLVSPCGGSQEISILQIETGNGQLGDTFSPTAQLSGFAIYPSAIGQDAVSGAYYIGGSGYLCSQNPSCLRSKSRTPATLLLRVDGVSGVLDTSFGSGGAAAVSVFGGGQWTGTMTVDAAGSIVFGGIGYVARVDSSGSPDAGFGTSGVSYNLDDDWIRDVRTDTQRRVYVLEPHSSMLRLKSNGQRDTSFGSNSDIHGLNGFGSAWQSMSFADSTHSSVFLLGGVDSDCEGRCFIPAATTTAMIAKANLVDSAPSSGETVTVLNSSATTVTTGAAITFTAGVNGSNPYGVITFRDGSVALASVNLVDGSASYRTSRLNVGRHAITAEYVGDTHNRASTSQTVSQWVQARTVVDLSTSASTVTSGDSVTFTVTARGANPMGMMEFYDGDPQSGGAILAEGIALTSGVASYTTSALSVGSHTISAGYQGDEINAAARSSSVVVTINSDPAPVPGGNGGNTGNGGGGALAWWELCGMLLLGLWRRLSGSQLMPRDDRGV
jgi:Bacterial Ig-like domain (group 3)